MSDEAEAVYTDELRAYIGLDTDTRRHETVSHGREEWVVGDVHTNSVEGVWSLFKRSIAGTFHKMSRTWTGTSRSSNGASTTGTTPIHTLARTTPMLQYRELIA